MESGSFEGWYAAEYHRLVAAVTLFTDDRSVACDAVDEAFSHALARWERVGVMAQPRSWVYRVATNEVRRRARRRVLEDRWARRQRSEASSEPSPDSELWDAVRRLPPRQREAVVLRFVMDLPEAEIAPLMGISRGTVSATLVHARRRLDEMLGATEDATVQKIEEAEPKR